MYAYEKHRQDYINQFLKVVSESRDYGFSIQTYL